MWAGAYVSFLLCKWRAFTNIPLSVSLRGQTRSFQRTAVNDKKCLTSSCACIFVRIFVSALLYATCVWIEVTFCCHYYSFICAEWSYECGRIRNYTQVIRKVWFSGEYVWVYDRLVCYCVDCCWERWCWVCGICKASRICRLNPLNGLEALHGVCSTPAHVACART